MFVDLRRNGRSAQLLGKPCEPFGEFLPRNRGVRLDGEPCGLHRSGPGLEVRRVLPEWNVAEPDDVDRERLPTDVVGDVSEVPEHSLRREELLVHRLVDAFDGCGEGTELCDEVVRAEHPHVR